MLPSFFSSRIFIGTSASNVFSIPLILLVLLLSLMVLSYVVLFYKRWHMVKNKREAELASKLHTEELERQGINLSTIYKSIPDLVFSKDMNSIYTSCNLAFERFVGCSEVELIGKSDMELFSMNQGMVVAFLDADKKVLKDECVMVIEEMVTYPDGTKCLMETLKTPMYQSDKVMGMMGISRDITSRKKSEVDAQIASKAKSIFLSQMSHEIRTPLNAIIGMSRIARLNIDNTGKVIISLDHVISASQHLLGVLNDVLDISKIEFGKMQLSQESCNIVTACEETNCIINERCNEKGLHYVHKFNVPPKMQLIFDKVRLFQVLINLLGNSVKFTESGGTIVFSLDIVEETEKTVALLFSISDNGIGMSELQLKKLFTPFEQTDSSISTRFGGTGLGLTISQSLVQIMRGKISVESILGVGTTFKFMLVFEKGCLVEANEPAPKVESFPNLEGVRILLVEDIEVNRLIVMEVLAKTKVEIVEAVDGKEAVKIFQEFGDNYFSLIFMDVQMPKMNGYEATSKIRSVQGSYAQNIPIIAMTANAYKEDVDAALKCGMNNHLSKPLDFNQLNQLLIHYKEKNFRQTS